MTSSRKNATKTRGRPFEKGNPGRPIGARNKTTLAVEALLEGEAENLTRAAINKALDGDTTALRLCLERICPVLKDRPVMLAIPSTDTAAGVVQTMNVIIAAVATGDLTPGEGQVLGSLVESQRRAIETENLERRVAALEQSTA